VPIIFRVGGGELLEYLSNAFSHWPGFECMVSRHWSKVMPSLARGHGLENPSLQSVGV
jgi:hypothetical protein